MDEAPSMYEMEGASPGHATLCWPVTRLARRRAPPADSAGGASGARAWRAQACAHDGGRLPATKPCALVDDNSITQFDVSLKH